jgi:hypothetical protein
MKHDCSKCKRLECPLRAQLVSKEAVDVSLAPILESRRVSPRVRSR